MSEILLTQLQIKGFLKTTTVEGDEILHLTTPCRFKIPDRIVKDLKENYKSDEEIGGLFWLKPTIDNNGEKQYLIDNVSYIRNAIEDTNRADHRNKSNAYLPDSKQLNQKLQEAFAAGYLPMKFHTHPMREANILRSITNQELMTETSKQDKFESSLYQSIETKKLLMPRGLIVGNMTFGKDIFIGVYNGFIAPTGFDESKKNVLEENLKKVSDKVSSMELKDGQKLSLYIGAVLLLFVIIRYSKTSLPIIFGILAILPILMAGTQHHDNPQYFNRLSYGDADIYIPEVEYN